MGVFCREDTWKFSGGKFLGSFLSGSFSRFFRREVSRDFFDGKFPGNFSQYIYVCELVIYIHIRVHKIQYLSMTTVYYGLCITL